MGHLLLGLLLGFLEPLLGPFTDVGLIQGYWVVAIIVALLENDLLLKVG